VVTFAKGLTLTLSPQGAGSYTLLLNGNIIDSGDKYPVVGQVIGSFTPPAA
jgi:hypothetical protein